GHRDCLVDSGLGGSWLIRTSAGGERNRSGRDVARLCALPNAVEKRLQNRRERRYGSSSMRSAGDEIQFPSPPGRISHFFFSSEIGRFVRPEIVVVVRGDPKQLVS